MLKGFDLVLVSANVKFDEIPHAKYVLPPEMKFLSAFSAFLFLFEAISKNLQRTHINLNCLILICLEPLLSISSLHSHIDVLL